MVRSRSENKHHCLALAGANRTAKDEKGQMTRLFVYLECFPNSIVGMTNSGEDAQVKERPVSSSSE